MAIRDAEHVAWRLLHDAQAFQFPPGGAVRAFLDERIDECGGPRGAVMGLVVAAGQLVQECSRLSGETALDVVERLQAAHALEHLEIDLGDEDLP